MKCSFDMLWKLFQHICKTTWFILLYKLYNFILKYIPPSCLDHNFPIFQFEYIVCTELSKNWEIIRMKKWKIFLKYGYIYTTDIYETFTVGKYLEFSYLKKYYLLWNFWWSLFVTFLLKKYWKKWRKSCWTGDF